MRRSKQIVSQDGALTVLCSNISQVCIASSQHALLQYLLLFDDYTVKYKTFYMLGYGIGTDISAHLPACHFGTSPTARKHSLMRMLDKVLIRIFKYAKFPFLRSADIYALDWGFAAPLIGRRQYSLLADCPLFMSHNMQETSGEFLRQLHQKHSLEGRLERWLIGNIAISGHGNNPQCQRFFLTEENVSPVLKNKEIHIQSLQCLWDNASNDKKNFVATTFNVAQSDVDGISGRDIMFMTQALITDAILSETEYLHLLNRLFSRYDQSKLLIKLHPRDRFDYRRYFPDVAVYDKPVNIQLLVLMGTSVSKAVTICSSSINAFPETVDVEWLGVEAHPALKRFYGDTLLPMRKYKQIQL